VEQEYPDCLTVTVSLKDDGHGTIEATADQEDGYTFTNTYEADPVDVTLHVDKEIDNQSNSENTDDTSFTFALIDNEGNTVEEKILSLAELENGVDFSTITYDTPGVYNYTLKEVEGSANGFTYDTTEYAVVITVEDHPDTTGALTAKVEINGNETSSLTITNIYKAEPTTAYIEIEKVLTGAENVPEVATFEFTLTGEGENKKTTIQGSGSGSFDVINYEQAGTYTYTVKETNSGAAGYTYDDTEYTVIVTVVDNGGKLEAIIKYMIGEEEAEIAKFENSYEATPITDYEVIVNKMLEGRDLEEGEFEFELVDTNGEVIATGTNDADGNVVFSGINFEEVGEYNFLVREIVDESRGEIDFDTNEYEVTIVVADNGEGELVIESDTSSEVIFKNKYNEPGKGENPRTDDDILSVVAVLIVSTIGLIGAVLFGKRSKEEATVEA
jgi:pilin isopeptide linkage protein